ncbi:MAG: class I SAM-dependent methyltransferase [Parvularculaceae bacterium]
MSRDRADETSFGFSTVPADEKARLVRGVFDSVADNYDLMNDLMSGGVHRIWKSVLLDRLAPQPGQALVDIAGGTGDIALGFLKRADDRPNADARPQARAIVCDINHEMLKAGRAREDAAPFEDRFSRVCGDAQLLPLPDRSADVYTIAFGIRNVTDMDAALRDAYRVLKPGGRFACLEFSHPVTDGLQNIYDAYSFNVIPWLGEKVAKNRESYQYLVESIRRFPAQDAFAARIRAAGFSRVAYENLTGGVAALHTAWRI